MQGEFEKTIGGLAQEHVFADPIRLSNVPSWQGHIPFAYFLAGLLKPGVLVELGTHKGDSYSAFCQTVKSLKLATRCFAVDTWEGDDHAGQYSNDIYNDISRFNAANFSEFSNLLRLKFENAVAEFEDRSIDVLHIDGLHTYEAVKSDFETWAPKLSERSVVLFHDTQVREGDFGVWKFWGEISKGYPAREFSHSHGLGVLGYGRSLDQNVRQFLDTPSHEWAYVQRFFERLGTACSETGTRLMLEGDLDRGRKEHNHLLDVIRAQTAAFEQEQQHLKRIVAEGQIAFEREEQAAEEHRQAAEEHRRRIDAIENSTSWKVTAPLRAIARALGRSR